MLQKYRVNKKKESPEICINLVKYIQNYVNKNRSLKNIFLEIEGFIKIPNTILKQKTYQIVFNDFNFKKNKFENYNIFYTVIDFLKYLVLILISILFHRKNINKKKSYDLICDNVFDQNDVDRYSKLVKIFKRVCLLGNFINKKKLNFEDYLNFKKIDIGLSNLTLKMKFIFIVLSFKIFYFSIIDRTNYFRIFLLLIYDILKSNHIFSKIKAKYYFTNKFYGTSPIFNFYFKQAGGIKMYFIIYI